MRGCPGQGRGLVGNLAGLLGDQVGLRAQIGGVPIRQSEAGVN